MNWKKNQIVKRILRSEKVTCIVRSKKSADGIRVSLSLYRNSPGLCKINNDMHVFMSLLLDDYKIMVICGENYISA